MSALRLIVLTAIMISLAGSALAENDVSPFGDDSLPTWHVSSRMTLSLGTPAGINLGFVYFGQSKVGIRVSGGLFPGAEGSTMMGVQGELVLPLYLHKTTSFDISFGGGTSYLTMSGKDYKWNYGGIFCSIASKDFFLQTGLSAGSGSYDNPQLTLQLGINLANWRYKD
ncbi:MAG: hypothetical protein WAU88_09265 [Candidatus Zixiibacteriota bacterium]